MSGTAATGSPGGGGASLEEIQLPPTPAQSRFCCPHRKNGSGVMATRETGLVAVVEGFVAGLELEGAEDVLGRVAVELARALEEAPGYSKARLAHQLRECVDGPPGEPARWRRYVRVVRSGRSRTSGRPSGSACWPRPGTAVRCLPPTCWSFRETISAMRDLLGLTLRPTFLRAVSSAASKA
jgi:hypothetical protein